MDPSLAHLISWSEQTKGEIPLPLTGPSITISPLPSPHPPTIFLFGGKYVHNRKLTNEMWSLDLTTKTWDKIDPGLGPGPRYFHSMDAWQDKIVCFGGMSDSEPTAVHNDLWLFDCTTRRWLPQIQDDLDGQQTDLIPLPRYAHLSAISRGKLVISGGQHSDNSWIYEMNVYDLHLKRWISRTPQPEARGMHSKGAYRSVAASAKQRVINPSKSSDGGATIKHSYSIEEEGEGGDVWCYSNYDFAKVRRELEIIGVEQDSPGTMESHYASPPGFSIRDDSPHMSGVTMPPGLRFPTGGVIGNHFILCGLYLASSSAAFSLWSLDLRTHVWRHLEPSVLQEGSWNRALIWPERAKILVFGNLESDLSADYGKRAVSVDHMAVISLETYGIYRPPKLEIPVNIQERSLIALGENLASDFEVISEEGRRVKCSRHVLRERWPWFAAQEREMVSSMAGEVKDMPAIDIADTLLGSFEPTKIMPTSLTLKEPFPVCVALVQYFYTQSLSTPLQNRAPILSALLFLAKQYKIDRLARLVVHALHERLEPSVAVGVYEIATLSGEQALQIRALNMIHSNKSSHRGHRRRPEGSQDTSGKPNSPGPNSGMTQRHAAPGQAGSGSGGSGAGPAAGQGDLSSSQRRHNDDNTHRRARVESMTLVDPAEEEALQLLDTLTKRDEDDIPIRRSPTLATPRPPQPQLAPSPLPPPHTQLPARPPIRRPPSMMSTMTTSTTSVAGLPYLTPDSEASNSQYTPSTSGPLTPTAESVRFSLDSLSIGSKSPPGHGQNHGLGLPSISQDPNEFTWSFRDKSDVTRDDHHVMKPVTKSSTSVVRSHSTSRPPESLSGQQAHMLAKSNDSYAVDKKLHRASVDTRSSYSQQSDAGWSPSTPVSPTYGTIDVHLDSGSMRSHGSQSSKFNPSLLSSDTASVSSGSTGLSTSSSKRAAREEKKLIQVAEKAARKAEEQAKFEARKAEMVTLRAAQQRHAETVKQEARAKSPKPEPKSKFGKFGQKFTSAVLFPEGGKDSNYF